MSDTARSYQPDQPANTEGLDDFFESERVTGAISTGNLPVTTDALEPVASLVSEHSGVPVEVAAELLGTSANALKKRLRKGTIQGYKLETKHGEKWFVEQSSLPHIATPVIVPLEQVPQAVVAPVLNLAEPITGAVEPVPNLTEPITSAVEPVLSDATQLLEKIRKLESRLEGAAFRNGYLEAENQGLKELLGVKDTHIKLLTDSQHKPTWWSRFSTWFLGSR